MITPMTPTTISIRLNFTVSAAPGNDEFAQAYVRSIRKSLRQVSDRN